MVKYRRRLDIIADVLKAVGNGAKKTRVMYIANLSYNLMEKYLGETVKVKLVRFNGNAYELTEKGRVFLDKYQVFSSKYSKLEKEFNAVSYEREVLEKMCESARDIKSKSYKVMSQRQRN